MTISKILISIALLSLACGPSSQDATAPAATTAAQSTAAAPPPPPPPPPRPRYIVPAGTRLPIELQTTLSTDSSRPGDAVVAVLSEDVPLEGFKLDSGAEVRGTVRTVVEAKRVKGKARLVIDFDTVMKANERLAIETEPFDATARSTKSKDKKIIGGGALGGLIIGAIKDGKKGALIGTAAGAAAGTGAVLVMKGEEVELPRGAKLTLTVR